MYVDAKRLMPVVAAGMLAFASPVKAQETLVAAAYGGVWGDAITKCVLTPFSQSTGMKAVLEPGNSNINRTKLKQQMGNPTFTVVWMDGGVSELAGEDGSLAALDAATIPNMKGVASEGLYKNSKGEIYAIGTGYFSFGIIYNTEKVKQVPTSWWDLWKPEYAGQVLLPSTSNAFGVPFVQYVAKLAGGSAENIEPAIKKFKELKVSSYADGSGPAANAFQSGEAIIGGFYGSVAWQLADQGLPIAYVIPKEGVLASDMRIHIPKGTPKMKEALQLANFAIAKEQAGCLAETLSVGPATMGVTVSEAKKPRLPWGKDGSIKNLAVFDWNKVNEQRDKVVDAFNRQVIGK